MLKLVPPDLISTLKEEEEDQSDLPEVLVEERMWIKPSYSPH
jgi:hypothetical protein